MEAYPKNSNNRETSKEISALIELILAK